MLGCVLNTSLFGSLFFFFQMKPVNLLCKLVDWFLYERDIDRQRVKVRMHFCGPYQRPIQSPMKYVRWSFFAKILFNGKKSLIVFATSSILDVRLVSKCTHSVDSTLESSCIQTILCSHFLHNSQIVFRF